MTNSEFLRITGLCVRFMREARCLDAETVANRVSLNVREYAALEDGKMVPTHTTVLALCYALDCSYIQFATLLNRAYCAVTLEYPTARVEHVEYSAFCIALAKSSVFPLSSEIPIRAFWR